MSAKPARPLRILLAKLGLDTHTVGITVVAHALREAGMEVIFAGLKQTPEMVVSAAIQEDVDVVGISSLSAGHTRSLPRLARLLREQGGADKLLDRRRRHPGGGPPAARGGRGRPHLHDGYGHARDRPLPERVVARTPRPARGCRRSPATALPPQ